MSFTQCYNTVNIPLPTYTATDSAAAEADESCSTSSGSSSASSNSMSMSFTPVHVTVRPLAEEHSDVSDTDGERADSPCSTSSNSSSASSDSMSMCFTPVYVASRPIGDVPSKIIGTNDVDDDNESDSCYDKSTSSSIVSEQYSPCLYKTGVQATAPRRFRYRALLPTIIGRPARDFSMRQLDTPSMIPVRTLQVKATHQTATIPAVGSKGRESFPSFVIGGIEPRPAGSIKAPRYKAIKPIVAAPHVPWFMRSPPPASSPRHGYLYQHPEPIPLYPAINIVPSALLSLPASLRLLVPWTLIAFCLGTTSIIFVVVCIFAIIV
ncbi:unnamed protein product [Tilletia controversa]|nr:unnamed protein product [Tilletia controversa]